MKGNHTNWDEKHLLDKGFIKDNQGNWHKPELKVSHPQVDNNNIVGVNLASTGIASPIIELKESVLTIHGIVAGLNSSAGLIRSHWAQRKKQKEVYQTIVRQHYSEGKIKKHVGKVRVKYIGYKSSFMDWDNFCSSFKLVGDALVEEGMIIDDSPKILVEFVPRMIKCSRADQQVVVVIQDVADDYQPNTRDWN